MKPLPWVLSAAALTILLATAVPAVLGPVRYDALVAVNLAMTIAVIATAVYAAANLSEFRKAREAEYTPFLDIVARIVRERGTDKSLHLELRNIGRGAAAGLEVALWQTDKDLVMWIPERVPLDRDLLLSGEAASGAVEFEGFHPLFQKHFSPGWPAVIVQVRYRDALTPEVERFYPYDLPARNEEVIDLDMSLLRPSPLAIPQELHSVEGKQRMLDEVLARAVQQLGLDALGLKVVGKVTRRAVSIRVFDGDAELWRAQTGPTEGIYHLVEWLEGSAEELRQAQVERTQRLKDDGTGVVPPADHGIP